MRKKSKNIVHAFWKNLAQKSDRHGRISDLASKGFIYLGGVFVFNFFFNFSYLFLKVFIESVAVLLLFYVLTGHKAHRILVPHPGIKPAPPALEGEVLPSGLSGKSLSFLLKCSWLTMLC